VQADHDRPPDGFSRVWKPRTSKTITPHSPAAMAMYAISMNNS
jgi:hypothetical protein